LRVALFLVLAVVFSLKYQQAIGYPGLFEKAMNLDERGVAKSW
jgi:hypothetical protein